MMRRVEIYRNISLTSPEMMKYSNNLVAQFGLSFFCLGRQVFPKRGFKSRIVRIFRAVVSGTILVVGHGGALQAAVGARNRTPGASPFVNSTPAASKAFWMRRRVPRRASISPARPSSLLIVAADTPA